ncbi:MAG: hypothetical protein HeimC2_00910 [Candidatus Heimdallarchaeota archaeon LC_2]|nr:MAG: hypothetical protein HeimC2_00910 [Candidatus Heimdallarchaeota archaeon LC_2]
MSDDKGPQLKKIIESLGEIANRDNHISDEEFDILKQVSFDIIKYDKALKNALEDGIITTHEQLQLSNLKAQIEKNVISVADKDHKITDDEAAMIKKLSEVMKSYF